MHEAAPCRQRNAAAVERDAGEAEMSAALALEHRGAAIEDEPGRATRANQLRPIRQTQQAGTIDAGRQRQWRLYARGFIDGALQGFRLIVGTAGPHAVLRGVTPERGRQRCRARDIRRCRQRAGNAGGGSSHQVAAVDVHDRVFREARCAPMLPEVTQKSGRAG
jgi:hypothetical protein